MPALSCMAPRPWPWQATWGTARLPARLPALSVPPQKKKRKKSLGDVVKAIVAREVPIELFPSASKGHRCLLFFGGVDLVET